MASSPRIRITNSIVDKLQPGQLRFDTDVRGFGIRCQRSAKKYVLKTRLNGRQRWFTIGEHGSPWTPVTAREEALRILGKIHSGASLDEIRLGPREEPTIQALCQRYIDDYAHQHKKASSVREDERNIRNHVIPLLGKNWFRRSTAQTLISSSEPFVTGRQRRKTIGVRVQVTEAVLLSLAAQQQPIVASRFFRKCSISPNSGA